MRALSPGIVEARFAGRIAPLNVRWAALAETALGVAGAFEVVLPDGRVVCAAGRWDDAERQSAERAAHIAEHVWIDGEYVDVDDGETSLLIGSLDLTVEDVAQALCRRSAIDGEATARQRLRSAFEGYVAWQAAECARRGIPPDGWADARTFVEWVRDEVLVGPDAESYQRGAL